MSSLPSRVSGSPAPVKAAAQTLHHASATNTAKLKGTLPPGAPGTHAAEEAELKKTAKKKRFIKFFVIASVVLGGALAIYKRQAIVSGFRNLLSGKQPVEPVIPEPVEVTVTNKKPLAAAIASSPFIFELGRQLGKKASSHSDPAKERASFERGERAGFSRGKASGERRGPTVEEKLAQAQAEYESYRKGKADGERLGKASGKLDGYREGVDIGERSGYQKGKNEAKKASDDQRHADYREGVIAGGKYIFKKAKEDGYRPVKKSRYMATGKVDGKEVPVEVEEID